MVEVLQQIPHAVTGALPSEVIVAPLLAEKPVIAVTAVVVTVGKTTFVVVKALIALTL